MLITLQSDSNGNASQFSNFFKETVQIQPDSEIALVSASYKFTNSIVILSGVNDTFSVRLGATDDAFDVVVNAGDYPTQDAFISELNTALRGALLIQPYRVIELKERLHQQVNPLHFQMMNLDLLFSIHHRLFRN
jgi:hypothetical protein